ncbi:MAG: DUF6111 family protein [Pseudomonadota bacterium]|nr:DUF6111 family protein [Pseudomonadota bacterium]
MVALILLRVLLFLTPFVLFLVYVRVARRRAESGRPVMPMALLTIAGLVLVLLSFLVLGFQPRHGIDVEYIPPHMENGKLVPAQTRPKSSD